MPLPIELMIDPETGHVDLPLAPWDSPMEAEVKTRLREDFKNYKLPTA